MKKNITLIITLLLSLFLVSSCTRTKKTDYSEFTKAYNQFIELATNEFGTQHGLSLAIVKDNQIIFEKYHGLADLETDKMVDKNTLFYIASTTKSFTALAALILESKGELDLERSLSEYFPEINFDPSLKADSITIRNLVQHTSGIENDPIIQATAYTGIHNPNMLLEMLSQLTTINVDAPYGVYGYTNLGYNILSMIIDRELDTNWQAVLDEEIFEPLQMTHTSAIMSDAKKNGWEVAKPLSQVNVENKLKSFLLAKKDNTMHAAGGMITSSRDIARWLIMELNSGKIEGKQIFDSKMIKNSVFPHANQDRKHRDRKELGYGYGWESGTTELGDTLISHGGGFVGTHSEVSFMPSAGLGIVVLANNSTSGKRLGFLLSSYAYDYFSGREDINTYYQKKIKEYKEEIKELQERRKKRFAERMEMQWQFDLAFSNYAGTYTNELLGSLKIAHLGDNRLVAEIGNLKSPLATPYKHINSIRVEMTPNNGSIIQFVVNDGKVKHATFWGQTYTKHID
ncbi:serine hydrolase domain-containing protein [Maribacter antarcticus]|uniref:serine hydrolase domain-containing protein n=1 Tax=Maribacter antarcticus TaxID=505250 RepID=UPI00047D21B8|nr:serine hydrolase domain-containing protein [Maribacter antarcticus]